MKYSGLVLILLGIFSVCVFWNLGKAGLHIDESHHALWTVETSRFITEQLNTSPADRPGIWHHFPQFESVNIKLFGLKFPAMTCFFTGYLIVYTLIPSILLFGMTPFALRLPMAITAILSLVFIYKTVTKWYGRQVGLICLCLLCFNVNLIFAARSGITFEEILIMFCVWSGLYALTTGIITSSYLWLWAGGFMFGIGLWAKLTTLAFILMLPVLYRLQKNINTALRKHWLPIGAGLLCGAFPLILYNIQHQFPTIVKSAGSITAPTYAGVNNLKFFQNLAIRVDDFLHLFGLMNTLYGRIHIQPDRLNLALALISILYAFSTFIPGIRNKYYADLRPIAAILIIFFILSCFVPSHFDPFHLLVLYPWVPIVQANLIYRLTTNIGNKHLRITFLALAITVFLVPHISAGKKLYQTIRHSIFCQHQFNYTPVVSYAKQNSCFPLFYLNSPNLEVEPQIEFFSLRDPGQTPRNENATFPNSIYMLQETGPMADAEQQTVLNDLLYFPSITTQILFTSKMTNDGFGLQLIKITSNSRQQYKQWLAQLFSHSNLVCAREADFLPTCQNLSKLGINVDFERIGLIHCEK